MSGIVLFLWRVAPGAELADLLPPAASGAQSICNRNDFHRTLPVARAPFASAHGIRRNARAAQKQAMEARSINSFLCCLFALGDPPDSTSHAGPPIQLSGAREFVGGGLRHHAGGCAGVVRRLGKTLRNGRPGQATTLFSLGGAGIFRGVLSGGRWLAF